MPAHWKRLMHHSCESLAEDRSQGAATPSTSAGPKNGKSRTVTTGSPWAEKCRCWWLVCTDTGRMMVAHLQQNFTSLHCQGRMGSGSLMVISSLDCFWDIHLVPMPELPKNTSASWLGAVGADRMLLSLDRTTPLTGQEVKAGGPYLRGCVLMAPSNTAW